MARPALRRAVKALAATTAVALAATGAAVGLVFTPAGGEWVRTQAVEAANGALAGRLEVGRLQLRPTRLQLDNVALSTPEGTPALKARAVELVFHPLALLDRTVHVESLAVEGLELPLSQDGRGLNLARAATPRQPSTSPTPAFAFRVDAVRVPGARVTLSAEKEGAQVEQLRLPSVSLSASASGTSVPLALTAALTLDGRSELPVDGPLKLQLNASLAGEAVNAQGRAQLAGAEAEFDAKREGTERATVHVTRLLLPPDTARALAGKWPLLLPLSAHASLEQSGNLVTLQAGAEAGRAAATVNAKVDLARLRLEQLEAEASRVDLSELLHGGPASDLSAKLSAAGHGTAETLTGQLSVDVSPGRLSRESVGPVRVRAAAEDGKVQVKELLAVLPGARLEASGSGTVAALSLRGTLDATDLAALAGAVAAFTDTERVALAGRGKLTVTASGPVKSLSVRLSGRFPTLASGTTKLQDVQLDAALPDVRRPWEASGKLAVPRMEVAGRTFREVLAEVSTRGRTFNVDARLRGLTALVFHAGGTLDKDRMGMQLEALGLDTPEARWTLDAPVPLRFADGNVQVGKLSLSARDQSLSLSGGLRGRALDATLKLSRLDLARLPSTLLPEELALEGRLSGTVHAGGRTTRPEVDAELSLQKGRVKGLDGMELQLLAAYRDERLRGSAVLASTPGRLRATFDVPLKGLQQQRHEPLAVSIELAQLDVARAVHAAGRKDDASGTLSGTLQLQGFADAPVPRLHLEAEQLRVGGWPAAAIPGAAGQLDVRADDAGELGLSLLADAQGARVRAKLQTKLTTTSLRNAPPTADSLRTLPITLELETDALPLAPFAPGTKGDAHLLVHATGTPAAPVGDATLQLKQVRRGTGEPVSGTLTLRAEADAVSVTGELERAVAPLLHLEGRVQAPLGELARDALHHQAPLQLSASVAPTAIASLAALAGEPLAVQGEAALQLAVDGTLAHPRGRAELSVERLGTGSQALGALRLVASAGGGQVSMDGALSAPGGGQMTLALHAPVDVSLAALAQGVDAEKTPLEGTVEASSVDLAFLTGAHPKLRALAGKLDLSAKLGGTLASPGYDGKVAWRDGRIAWLGYGEYRDVQLRARATQDAAWLDTFSLQGGGGTLTAQGLANRRATGWALEGGVKLARFPLVLDDQLYAYASLDGTLKGTWDAALADFTEVRLPGGMEVELPQVKRKDLQDLDRPEDVFRNRDGRWLDGLPRKLRAARAQGSAAPPGRTYRAALQLEKGVVVRGMDMVAVLGLQEGFRVEYQEALRLFGEVKLLSGRFEVLGRRFVVQKDSVVQFQGAAKSPLVNVSAAWTSEREQVTVTMAVRGTGSDLQLRPTSQPPLPESDIYTLLATGRRQLKRGSGSSMTGAEAATVVGSALASQLRKTLPGKVPLDVLSVEAGEEGSLAGSKLEAGTYVTDKVYVGYTGRLGANAQRGENSHEVRFEYQVTPRWSLEASFGDAFSGGADLVWTRDY